MFGTQRAPPGAIAKTASMFARRRDRTSRGSRTKWTDTDQIRGRGFSFLPILVGLGLFALGLGALYHLLRPVHAAEVLAQVRATPPATLAGAVLATAVGYAALIGYDWSALRHIGRRLPLGSVATGAFLGSAFGNTLGVSVVSGGAVRCRNCSALGLDAFEVAGVSSHIAVATGLGLTLIGLGGLAVHPGALVGVVALPAPALRWGAVALVVGVLGLVFARSASGRALRLGRFTVALPGPRILLGQMAISLIDIVAAAFTLWLLLPDGKPEFAGFVAIFSAATMIGVLSHVPGGIGVFETAIIAAMPDAAPVGEIAAALLTYRMVYYLLPFALAFLLLSVAEARQVGGVIARRFADLPTSLKPAFGAFWLSLAAIGGGIVAALMNDQDIETAALLIAGGLALLPFRGAFHRRAKLTDGVFSPEWFALVAAVAIAAAAFFFFVHRATPYSHDLWTEFARGANTPRSLRAGLAASAVMLVFTLFLSLRPSHARRAGPPSPGRWTAPPPSSPRRTIRRPASR